MEKITQQTVIDPEPEQGLDNGTEPLIESGFEEEKTETDFDERM